MNSSVVLRSYGLDPLTLSLSFENSDNAGEIRMSWPWLVMMCIRRIGNTLERHSMAFNMADR
jgi:hypothetical protein